MAATMQHDARTSGGGAMGAWLAGVEWDRVGAAGAAGVALGAVTGAVSQKKFQAFEKMAAPLVGSDSAAVGAAVHLLAAGTTGALFGLLPEPRSVPKAALEGAAFGGAVWAAGPLVGVHLMNDMPLKWGKVEKMSLVGHVAWGAGLAAVSTLAVRKLRQRRQDVATPSATPAVA